jgi:putative CocE/NonD family hydrolase
MVVQGAGGAMGSAAGRYTYFGIFEGGVPNLASAVGWFAQYGQKTPGEPAAALPMTSTALASLPSIALVRKVRTSPTDYEAFLTHAPGDPWWDALGYLAERDEIAVPTLAINTWEDQTVADTLVIASRAARLPALDGGLPRHPVIIAPGDHCEHEAPAGATRIGDLEVRNAQRPYWQWYLDWFGYWVLGDRTRRLDLSPYLYFVLGEQRWLRSDVWPPRAATAVHWYLGSGRGANGVAGDGVLDRAADRASRAFDEFRYDPADPVPSRGGPVCCTGNPNERAGHVDQADVERRTDVLVYTSQVLSTPLRIVGPLSATLVVSSDAADTDIVAKLVDVAPDGTALNIQEGALRLRYRDSFTAPQMMRAGEKYRVTVDMRAIAYYLPAGHRLRLQIASSNFPRLERNLNTGGRNYDETSSVVASNRVWLQGESFLAFHALDDAAAAQGSAP